MRNLTTHVDERFPEGTYHHALDNEDDTGAADGEEDLDLDDDDDGVDEDELDEEDDDEDDPEDDEDDPDED